MGRFQRERRDFWRVIIRTNYGALWYGLLVGLLLFASCSSEDDPENIPTVSLASTTVTEGDTELMVVLNTASNQEINVKAEIVGGNAVEGVDFTADALEVIIPAGEVEASLGLTFIDDVNAEITEALELTLSVNGEVSNYIVSIVDNDNFNQESISEDDDGYFTPTEYASMQLVWSDEFEGETLKTDFWSYDLGDGCDQGICGWGNQELQVYTEENALIGDGKLTIRADESATGTYNSARIITKGKYEFQFGRIDIRAKLPKGQGIWPALWLLGVNIDEVGWPRCGEIDLMELVGHEPATVHGTVHYDLNGHNFTGRSFSLSGSDFSEEFHVFSLVWDKGILRWFVDYRPYYTITDADLGGSYPFDRPFYFLFNVAIGGQWPGNPDASTSFPQEMVVDYIRVFQ